MSDFTEQGKKLVETYKRSKYLELFSEAEKKGSKRKGKVSLKENECMLCYCEAKTGKWTMYINCPELEQEKHYFAIIKSDERRIYLIEHHKGVVFSDHNHNSYPHVYISKKEDVKLLCDMIFTDQVYKIRSEDTPMGKYWYVYLDKVEL